MLYVTTRNNDDAYTANRALRENRGGDGGLYVPFRMPVLSPEEIAALGEKSFSVCVADTLNMLFNSRMTAWDVEFCVGRLPVRLANLSQKIIVAESWHNSDWKFERMVSGLVAYIRKEAPQAVASGCWAEMGVRMAVLFGIFGELIRAGLASPEKKVDVSVVSGDFSGPMCVWYVREMGLPIGNIICCCNENNSIWDLMHHGQLRTDLLSIQTSTPAADIALPSGLERLVHAAGGVGEVQRYLEVCRRGGMYCPDDWVLSRLRRGICVSVVSRRRVDSTIPSVYGTNQYLLSPYGALAYAGLQDYRAKTGESRHAVVLTESSPACDAETVANALGISVKELDRISD